MSTGPYRKPSTPLTRTEDKYNNDPAFRNVVDSLQGIIVHLQLTPGELREAAVYACMRVEERRFADYLVPLDPEIARHVVPSVEGLCPVCGHLKNSASCRRLH